jgi:hypothetical protein
MAAAVVGWQVAYFAAIVQGLAAVHMGFADSCSSAAGAEECFAVVVVVAAAVGIVLAVEMGYKNWRGKLSAQRMPHTTVAESAVVAVVAGAALRLYPVHQKDSWTKRVQCLTGRN